MRTLVELCVLSVREAMEGRTGWVRAGHRICYFRNSFVMNRVHCDGFDGLILK